MENRLTKLQNLAHIEKRNPKKTREFSPQTEALDVKKVRNSLQDQAGAGRQGPHGASVRAATRTVGTTTGYPCNPTKLLDRRETRMMGYEFGLTS